jgi:hypothetical protein
VVQLNRCHQIISPFSPYPLKLKAQHRVSNVTAIKLMNVTL